MNQEQQEFELDFITTINMFGGMEYEDAVQAAREEMKEVIAYEKELRNGK